jgi:dolichol-phosphate mannosyltransferase
MKKAVILIPTFNEALTIIELLVKLNKYRGDEKLDFDALIIDDNSPDKTAQLVKGLVAELGLNWVRVMHRPKKAGLGAAYRAGFADVLSLEKYSHIVTMDADGSHRVQDLPAMFSAAGSGKSITLGTRWMPGGAVVNWPLARQLLSKAGTKYAKLSLGIPLRDLTGGFRIYSAELLNSLNLSSMDATGYCFQIEMALASDLAGATSQEVPITFVERKSGVSKMSKTIVVEALIQTTRWAISRRLRPNADKLHYVK